MSIDYSDHFYLSDDYFNVHYEYFNHFIQRNGSLEVDPEVVRRYISTTKYSLYIDERSFQFLSACCLLSRIKISNSTDYSAFHSDFNIKYRETREELSVEFNGESNAKCDDLLLITCEDAPSPRKALKQEQLESIHNVAKTCYSMRKNRLQKNPIPNINKTIEPDQMPLSRYVQRFLQQLNNTPDDPKLYREEFMTEESDLPRQTFCCCSCFNCCAPFWFKNGCKCCTNVIEPPPPKQVVIRVEQPEIIPPRKPFKFDQNYELTDFFTSFINYHRDFNPNESNGDVDIEAFFLSNKLHKLLIEVVVSLFIEEYELHASLFINYYISLSMNYVDCINLFEILSSSNQNNELLDESHYLYNQEIYQNIKTISDAQIFIANKLREPLFYLEYLSIKIIEKLNGYPVNTKDVFKELYKFFTVDMASNLSSQKLVHNRLTLLYYQKLNTIWIRFYNFFDKPNQIPRFNFLKHVFLSSKVYPKYVEKFHNIYTRSIMDVNDNEIIYEITVTGNILSSILKSTQRGFSIEQLGDNDCISRTKTIKCGDIIYSYGRDIPDIIASQSGIDDLTQLIYSNVPVKMRIITNYNSRVKYPLSLYSIIQVLDKIINVLTILTEMQKLNIYPDQQRDYTNIINGYLPFLQDDIEIVEKNTLCYVNQYSNEFMELLNLMNKLSQFYPNSNIFSNVINKYLNQFIDSYINRQISDVSSIVGHSIKDSIEQRFNKIKGFTKSLSTILEFPSSTSVIEKFLYNLIHCNLQTSFDDVILHIQKLLNEYNDRYHEYQEFNISSVLELPDIVNSLNLLQKIRDFYLTQLNQIIGFTPRQYSTISHPVTPVDLKLDLSVSSADNYKFVICVKEAKNLPQANFTNRLSPYVKVLHANSSTDLENYLKHKLESSKILDSYNVEQFITKILPNSNPVWNEVSPPNFGCSSSNITYLHISILNKDYLQGSKDDELVQSSFIKLNLSDFLTPQTYVVPLYNKKSAQISEISVDIVSVKSVRSKYLIPQQICQSDVDINPPLASMEDLDKFKIYHLGINIIKAVNVNAPTNTSLSIQLSLYPTINDATKGVNLLSTYKIQPIPYSQNPIWDYIVDKSYGYLYDKNVVLKIQLLASEDHLGLGLIELNYNNYEKSREAAVQILSPSKLLVANLYIRIQYRVESLLYNMLNIFNQKESLVYSDLISKYYESNIINEIRPIIYKLNGPRLETIQKNLSDYIVYLQQFEYEDVVFRKVTFKLIYCILYIILSHFLSHSLWNPSVYLPESDDMAVELPHVSVKSIDKERYDCFNHKQNNVIRSIFLCFVDHNKYSEVWNIVPNLIPQSEFRKLSILFQDCHLLGTTSNDEEFSRKVNELHSGEQSQNTKNNNNQNINIINICSEPLYSTWSLFKNECYLDQCKYCIYQITNEHLALLKNNRDTLSQMPR